jgi:hypothetical protein
MGRCTHYGENIPLPSKNTRDKAQNKSVVEKDIDKELA